MASVQYSIALLYVVWRVVPAKFKCKMAMVQCRKEGAVGDGEGMRVTSRPRSVPRRVV